MRRVDGIEAIRRLRRHPDAPTSRNRHCNSAVSDHVNALAGRVRRDLDTPRPGSTTSRHHATRLARPTTTSTLQLSQNTHP